MALTEHLKSRANRKPRTDEPRHYDSPTPPQAQRETPVQPEPVGVPHDPVLTDEAGPGLVGVGGAGGARLLAADARVAFLLINYARLRSVARLFGVGPEQANLVTAVALLMLAESARRGVRKLMEGPPTPSLEEGLLGGAVVGELLSEVAGLSSRGTRQPTTLLALAVVGGLAGPSIVRSIRGVKASSHRAAVSFHRRYGYLIDPGHWREHHAQRPNRMATPPGRPVSST